MGKINYGRLYFQHIRFPPLVIFPTSLHFSGIKTSQLEAAITLEMYHNIRLSSPRGEN